MKAQLCGTWHTALISPLHHLIKKKSVATFNCSYSTPHCVPVESNILQVDNLKSQKFEGNPMMNQELRQKERARDGQRVATWLEKGDGVRDISEAHYNAGRVASVD